MPSLDVKPTSIELVHEETVLRAEAEAIHAKQSGQITVRRWTLKFEKVPREECNSIRDLFIAVRGPAGKFDFLVPRSAKDTGTPEQIEACFVEDTLKIVWHNALIASCEFLAEEYIA